MLAAGDKGRGPRSFPRRALLQSIGTPGRVLALLAILLRVEAIGPPSNAFPPGRWQMRGGAPAVAKGGVSGKSAWRSWRMGVGDEKNEADRLRSILTEAETEVAGLCEDLLDARAAQGRANAALQSKDEKIASSELKLSDLRETSERDREAKARDGAVSESHSAQLNELREKLAALVQRERASDERMQAQAEELAEEMVLQMREELEAELEASRMIELASEKQEAAHNLAQVVVCPATIQRAPLLARMLGYLWLSGSLPRRDE